MQLHARPIGQSCDVDEGGADSLARPAKHYEINFIHRRGRNPPILECSDLVCKPLLYKLATESISIGVLSNHWFSMIPSREVAWQADAEFQED